MKTLALLDADILVYQCAAANAKYGGDLDDLHWVLQNTAEEWTQGAGADEYMLYATNGDTFRHHFYPEYKQNRKGKPKPRGFSEAREWVLSHDRSVWESGYEADDLMAMAASCPSSEGAKVIVSTDKDFNQVPKCKRYDPTKQEFFTPTESSADEFKLQQWVCGDTVDGYKGIHRYGPKTFAKDIRDEVFESWADMEKWGYSLYADKDAGELYATQMLICSTILNHNTPKQHLDMVAQILTEMDKTPK